MYTYKAEVIRVIDGDTISVNIDLGFDIWLNNQIIRLAKINAPELKGKEKEAGDQSKLFLQKQILNKRVTLRTEKDQKEKYGRWLATVLLEEDNNLIDINHKMIAEGFATKV